MLAQIILNNFHSSQDRADSELASWEWKWNRCIELGAGHGVTVRRTQVIMQIDNIITVLAYTSACDTYR